MKLKFICYFLSNSVLWNIGYLFNVDTKFPIIYSKPSETYFGYTVLFHTTFGNNWLLVGAPRANQSFSKDLKQPGTLFQCLLVDGDCFEVPLDVEGNVQSSKYYDLKDNQWLGVSLNENSEGTVVTCAHRWKDQQHYQTWKRHSKKSADNIQDYYSNGLCYTIKSELKTNTVRRQTPLITRRGHERDQVIDGIPNFCFGMAGMSSHFTEEGKLLLGAPGVYSWEGKLVTVADIDKNDPIPMVWAPDRSNEKFRLTNSIYLGYSVTSGRFFGTKPLVSYVVSAPRYNYLGKVYIVRPINNYYKIEYNLQGKQFGEYFGAALCAIDLNGDGYDDLIVGSPQFATVRDEGKIYIYINDNGEGFKEPLEQIGSTTEDARFGSTITALGDIDLDGYLDFAVGAPYEAGGVVYVYYGHENGINNDLTQRIEAKSIYPNLKGFGISIAKGKDIDRNSYLDLAIGSYESGHAVILRSLPPISFEAFISTDPLELPITLFPCQYKNRNVRCLKIKTCIRYKSPRTLHQVDVNVKLTFDAILTHNLIRGFFTKNGRESPIITDKLTLKGQHDKCEEYQVVLKQKINDYKLAIDILYEFQLPKQPKDAFCSTCPILKPKSVTSISHQVYFKIMCGNDSLCDSDLHLQATLVDELSQPIINPELWAGLNKTLKFDVKVSNSKDAAYNTKLNVTVPIWSNFFRYPTTCNELPSASRSHRFLICDIDDLDLSNRLYSLEIYLNIASAPPTLNELIINFNVTTGSGEDSLLLDDNNVVIKIPANASADITIYGSTPYQYALLTNLKTNTTGQFHFTHVYEVVNLGPSPLEFVQVTIEVPETSLDGSLKFIKSITIQTQDGKRKARVVECRGADSNYFTSRGEERHDLRVPDQVKRKKRSSDSKKNPQNVWAKSRQIKCDIILLEPNDIVKLTLQLVLDTESLKKLKLSADIIEYITEAKVVIINSRPNIQPFVHKPDFAEVVTSFDTGRVSPHDLPIWVIPVSIIVGVLLLFALAILFYKLGFFQRSQRDALKKAQQENSTDLAENKQDFSSQNSLVTTDE